MNPCNFPTAFLLATALAAQDPPAPAPTPRPAQTAIDAALDKLTQAGDADRAQALQAYFGAQLQTGAQYAGQYAKLKPMLDKVGPLLTTWLTLPPDSQPQEDLFRQAVVLALRDNYGEHAPDEVLTKLHKVCGDDLENPPMRLMAACALAQFGDRTAIDPKIETLTADTKADDARKRGAAWRDIADINYNLRDYAAAAKAYGELLALSDKKAINLAEMRLSAPTMLYNWACALALAGDKDGALARIEQALNGDYHGDGLRESLLRTDMDIASLRDDPRFEALLAKHFGSGKR